MKLLRWLLLFMLAAAPAWAAYAPENDVRAFGADPSGHNDSTAAFNTCLTKAGPGGTCYAGGGRFVILGNVTIPGNTTLSCGDSFYDTEDGSGTLLNTLPALMLDSAHTISAAGPSATIKNCLIERKGFVAPAADSSAYAGIATSDGGNGNFIVRDTVIIGFDTAILINGPRPWIHHVHADGNGMTHAVIDQSANGAFDVGYIEDIKIQSLGTNNFLGPNQPNCPATRRPGTGMRLVGVNYLGNIIAQNFDVAQVDLENQELGGYIWTDSQAVFCGPVANSVGLLLAGNAILYGTSVNLNATQVGIKVQVGENLLSNLPSVFLDYIGQDAILVYSGSLSIGTLNTNPYSTNDSWTGSISGTTMTVTALSGGPIGDGWFFTGTGVAPGTKTVGSCTTSCTVNNSQTVASTAMHALGAVGRYVVNIQDGTGQSRVTVNHAALNAVQGGVKPYFFTPGSANALGDQLAFDTLQTDLDDHNPFTGSGFALGPGTERLLQNIPMEQGPCSGMGTGVCTIQPGSTITRGAFLLQPAGTAAGTGAIFMSFAVPASTAYICNVQMASGSGAWPFNSSPLTLADVNGARTDVGWTAPLVPGQTYQILYSCKP